MNKEPTLLEINERIPISKQDYLHLLYRVEELERKVARLESKPKYDLKELLDKFPPDYKCEEAMCEYQPKEEDPFRDFPPLTPEQEATYGSISSNTENNMSAASERASSFIEKFNKQQ